MKAGVIAGLALLWRLLVWIWSILIIGIIVGVLGNAAYTYFTTGKLDITDPRTLPLLQWARIHLLLLVLILLGVLSLTLCAWLANRYQKKAMREGPHPQKEARYVSRFEAPSQGVVIGEHNTVTIYGQIPPDQHLPQEPALPCWNVPFPRNLFFTGREELLKRLHDSLTSRKAAALTQAISGLGGIGKTQTAVEYAYRYRDEYHDVLWVNAATRDMLIASFLDLARLLDLPEKDEQDQNITAQAVKRWLEQHEHWLLIVDNADDLALTEEFLPTGGKGHILLTTRAQAPGALAEGINVEKMDTEEGMLLLLLRGKVLARQAPLAQASVTERTAAESIVKAMDGLPLALDQAGAYIEETHCGVSAYLVNYRQRQAELLKRRGGTGKEHPEPVATTWSLSFEQVERLNPMATDLLQACAFLAPDAIPEDLLLEGASELGACLQPLTTDATRINDVIGVLLRYSLVKRDSQACTLSIHRLVQAVLKESMDEQTRREWAERTVRAVNLAFPDVTDVKLWEQCERALPHARVCARLIEEYSFAFAQASRLLDKTAYYLESHAQYTQAEPFYQRALTIREQQLGPEHPDTARSLNNLAGLYYEQGKYEQAESFYRRALAIQEQQLGPEHLHTATSLNNLAALYYTQGKYEQAEPLLQRALAIREKQLGPDHPDTASSLNNLAELYRVQGKYEQAEPLYQRALAIVEQQLGPEHPTTASSLNNLALLYVAQGKYEQAEPLYQRALAIKEKALGPERPSTATSLNNLALLYVAQGKYEQAAPLYQRALAIYEQQLEPEHPDTATARENYNTLVRNMKRKGEEQHYSSSSLRNLLNLGLPRSIGEILMPLFGKKKVETHQERAERLIAMRHRLSDAVYKYLEGKLSEAKLSNLFYQELLKHVPREYLMDEKFKEGFAPIKYETFMHDQVFFIRYEQARQAVLAIPEKKK